MFRNNLGTTKSFKPAMNWKCFLAIIPKGVFGIWNIGEVFKPKNSVTAVKHADYHHPLEAVLLPVVLLGCTKKWNNEEGGVPLNSSISASINS